MRPGETRVGYVKPGRREDYGLWLFAQGVGVGEVADVCAVSEPAVRAWLRETGVVLRPRPRCGTRSGYSAHRRSGEPACVECLRANAAYFRTRREAGTDDPPWPHEGDCPDWCNGQHP